MLKVNAGFTLLQLLISSAAGISLIAGAASLCAGIIGSQQLLIQTQLLESELLRLLTLVDTQLSASEFRALGQTRIFNEPTNEQLVIENYPQEVSSSCILFATDSNENGEFDNDALSEKAGFRLKEGAIEKRMAGKSCIQNGWQDITDNSLLIISKLQFTIVKAVGHSLVITAIDAHLSANPEIKRSVNSVTRLNHDVSFE